MIRESDILILAIPHQIYKTTDFQGKPILDFWGFLEKDSIL